MFFIFKKLISSFLMPLPLLFLVSLCGAGLSRFTNYKKTGKTLVVSAMVLLFFTCFEPFSFYLMEGLERTYPSLSTPAEPVTHVWVLGGGYANDPSIPLQSKVYPESMYRILEGLRIYRLNPGSKLIFSGYGGTKIKSVAEIGADVAVSLGVPESDIITITSPKDTREEAAEAKSLLNESPFILVTSASHMKRAMTIFSHQGLKPTPAPCGHYVKHQTQQSLSHYLPSSYSAHVMRRYTYETIGLIWVKLRRFIF